MAMKRFKSTAASKMGAPKRKTAKKTSRKTAAKKTSTTTKRRSTAKKPATKKTSSGSGRGRPSTIKNALKKYCVSSPKKDGSGSKLEWNYAKYTVTTQGPKTSSTRTHVVIRSRKTKEIVVSKVFPKGGGSKAKKYNGGQRRKKPTGRAAARISNNAEKTKTRLNRAAGVKPAASSGRAKMSAPKKKGAKKTSSKKKAGRKGM